MTMPELLREICAAQDAARLAGATDAEVATIRSELIAANRTGGNQEYVNQWTPSKPPEPAPKHEPVNPGRTKELWYDRF